MHIEMTSKWTSWYDAMKNPMPTAATAEMTILKAADTVTCKLNTCTCTSKWLVTNHSAERLNTV